MKNYFFISSPLHLLIAANLASSVLNRHTNVALLICKTESLAKQFENAIRATQDVFQQVISLPEQPEVGKLNHRTYITQPLDLEFKDDSPKQLFTGNDRRFEFQYAMYLASQHSITAKAIYMDDGAVSYLGHKSINKFAHRYIDPLLKKIAYGWWWKSGLTTGSSAWISDAYLAFPRLAHELLKVKSLHKLNTEPFTRDSTKALSQSLLDQAGIKITAMENIKLLITLPHEDVYLNSQQYLRDYYKGQPYKESEIAIKAHPRSLNEGILRDLFPNAAIIDKNAGFEALLPLLPEGVKIAGEASTTLLSAKWLRPELELELLPGTTKLLEMEQLLNAIDALKEL